MTTNQETTAFHLNLMPFRFVTNEIKVGFSTERSLHGHTIYLKDAPLDIQNFYPDLTDYDRLSLYFEIPKAFMGQKWLIDPTRFRSIARCYALFLLHRYFVKNEAYVQSNFVQDLVVWENDKIKTGNAAQFSRIQLKVKYYKEDTLPSISFSYLGRSHILLDHLSHLDSSRPDVVQHINKVIYNKQISYYDNLPEEAHADRQHQYPILNRGLETVLAITIGRKRLVNKHEKQLAVIKKFFENKLKDREQETALIFEPEWSATERLFKLDGAHTPLVFGNGNTHHDVYQGLRQYGAFEPLKVKQLVCFFIYTPEQEAAKEKLRKELLAVSPYKGLGAYMKLAVHYTADLDILITKNNSMSEQVAEQLSQKSLDTRLAYLAIYVSPFDKFTSKEDHRRVYYQIKEVLLKRGIASQTFVGAKALDPNTKINYWTPNVAMAAIAKLGGIPWVLNKSHQKALIVGFGLYSIKGYDLKFEGSSFVFSDDGHFRGFDYYPASESSALAAKLETALNQYIEKFGRPERLVIHYHKKMSRQQFRPIQKMLNNYDPGLPVFVVRVNQGRTNDFFVRNNQNTYGLPTDGSVFRLSGHDYLLYINGFTGEGRPKSQPMPVRCYLQANRPELLEDQQTVQELLQQVYDFTRLYWRSVKQPSVPVTIDYPRLLVSQTAWFNDTALPGGLEERPWFL